MAKKSIKNKHYYHKGPFYLFTDKKLDTPTAILLEIRKDKVDKKVIAWYDFIDKYGYRAQKMSLPEEENIIAIGNCILDSNSHLTDYYYSEIFKIFKDKYNPTCEKIPLDLLPSNLANIIKKKQQYIKNMYFYRKEYKDIDLLVQYNRRDIQNILNLDLRNYKHIVRLSGDNTYIYIRKAENIDDILKRLNKMENEINTKNTDENMIWSIDEIDKRKIKNNKKSKINFQNYHNLFCLFS